MPMGIVSDAEFDTEIARVADPRSDNKVDESDVSLRELPNIIPDTAIPLAEEVSDYEPKERSNDYSGGLELRSMGSSDGTNEAEDQDNNSRAIIHQIEKGRPKGRNNRTSEERAIIAGTALMNGNQFAIDQFGVSQSSVSAYKNGATSTSSYDEPDSELLKSVSAKRVKIANVAHGRLSAALDQITNEKLASASLKTVASVAQHMSAIIKNMEPEQASQNSQNIQFTFYAPKVRAEDQFDVIDMQSE